MIVYIKKDYTAQYVDGIAFDGGVPIHVVRGDAEYPAWFWCRIESGKEGWVHRSFLAGTEGDTVSLRDFRGNEATVTAGEEAVLECSLDGWAWVNLDDGRAGWIPESCVLSVTIP